MRYKLKINGEARTVDVPEEMPLLWVLRDELGLVGTKFGCGVGACGACTVHVDGAAIRSCQTAVADVVDAEIRTIEALHTLPRGRQLQQAWLAQDVMQCGYCQAGQLMSAAALLNDTPNPSDEDIDAAMAGNICRCACYGRIRMAIVEASRATEERNV